MHRMIEQSPVSIAELDAPNLENWETGDASTTYDDLYREDPYRFDQESANGREASPADDIRRIDYIPTPAEIAGVCAEIRAGWTKSEKRRRFVGELPPEAFDDSVWAPPVIDTSHFRLASAGSGESA